MNALSTGVEARHARHDTRKRWRPTWAIVISVLGILLALVPVVYGIGLLAQPSEPELTGPDFGDALGQVALLIGTVTIALFAWFLLRGNRFAFALGLVPVVLGLTWWFLL